MFKLEKNMQTWFLEDFVARFVLWRPNFWLDRPKIASMGHGNALRTAADRKADKPDMP